MSCPLCGEGSTCSHAGAASSLIDPEEYDLSEERFSASLAEVAAERVSGGTARGLRRNPEEARNLVGAIAVPDAGARAGPESREANRGVDEGAFWRNEVASRVESYRARRRRPIRERSLPLDFERAVNREITHGQLADSREEEFAAESRDSGCDAAAYSPAASPPDSGLATRDSQECPGLEDSQESKIIEFPRLAMLPVMPPSFEELAESLMDRPRILEAPEEVDTASPLSDISVAPEQEQYPAVEFELPLQVAPMSQRAFAGLVDALIVLLGAAVFVLIVLKARVPMPPAKAGFLFAMAASCVFWAIYEYLFLVYAGITPGMQMARLRLITFDGGPARRQARRGRAVAMVLSTLSLGLGLLWALLDEDTLCWHDRITRTYVVAGS
ncbi:MAG TPA: RDD family protein [Terriglobales bacterium]